MCIHTSLGNKAPDAWLRRPRAANEQASTAASTVVRDDWNDAYIYIYYRSKWDWRHDMSLRDASRDCDSFNGDCDRTRSGVAFFSFLFWSKDNTIGRGVMRNLTRDTADTKLRDSAKGPDIPLGLVIFVCVLLSTLWHYMTKPVFYMSVKHVFFF